MFPSLRSAVLLWLLFAACPSWQQGNGIGIPLSPAEFERQLQQAGTDPLKLLVLLPLADEQEGKVLCEKIKAILQMKGRTAPEAELRTIAQEFAQLLSTMRLAPERIEMLLGAPRIISRQLLYRRFDEQWRYEFPLPLLITITHRKGQAPVVKSVQVIKN